MTDSNIPSFVVSIFAAGISGISLFWAFKSWKETHRPLITARVTTQDAGNVGTTLNLVVSNTGNRPAKNVILRVNRNDLANGTSVSNSFGCFSTNERDRTWREPTVINIQVRYEDLDGRIYSHDQPLRIRGGGDDAFAAGSWG